MPEKLYFCVFFILISELICLVLNILFLTQNDISIVQNQSMIEQSILIIHSYKKTKTNGFII